jgi:hypothetical protein
MIILNQARAIVRELGFTLTQDVDRAEYRLRPVGAADDQAYYASDLADAVKTARQWDGVAKWQGAQLWGYARASRIACQTRALVAGMPRLLIPSGLSASTTALTIAGNAPTVPAWPAPFAPSGLRLVGTGFEVISPYTASCQPEACSNPLSCRSGSVPTGGRR